MHCTIREKSIYDIGDSSIVQQTAFWANIKSQQGFKPYAFSYRASEDLLSPSCSNIKYVQDDLLVLIRYLNDKYCFAYIPYGPKDEPEFENQGIFLEELSEVLRPILPENCILIRYDLHWENQWAHEDDLYDSFGNWTGPPSPAGQEFRINFNTRKWNLVKSPGNILPVNTFFINLKQSDEDLLKRMKPKTRYNIRLSERRGVKVRHYGAGEVDEWYSLYENTSARNNITLHPKDNFQYLLGNMGNYGESVDVRLLIADYEGEYLAAMILILSDKRGTYMYGASSGEKRNFMPSYAVQWAAIKAARKAGCEEYDMFGAAPNSHSAHPMHGLFRFKSGFGGSLFHRMGCWDYPLIGDEYFRFKAQEINNQSYLIR